jgi:hypothetical protein
MAVRLRPSAKPTNQVNLGELGPRSKAAPRLWGTKPDLPDDVDARLGNPDLSGPLMLW